MADFGEFAQLPTSGNPRAGDSTTLVTIEASPVPTFARDVVQLENLTTFSYSSDVMQMGDPFSVTVPDPRGTYVDKLLPGWSLRFFMSNSAVAGGARAQKLTGVVVEREVVSDESGGTAIRIVGADVGWHLVHNDAPLWFNLRGTTLGRLAEACVFPQRVFPKDTDPGWGFKDPIRTSNEASRALKRGLPFTEAERLGFVAAAMSNSVVWVQVQPGQKIADLLITYARRLGLLVGVSADAHLQFFLPDYAQAPAYEIFYSAAVSERVRNNVKQARRLDLLEPQYTHVTVVGENPIFQVVHGAGAVRSFVPQFTKLRGRARPENWPPGIAVLPFRRLATISDGEIVEQPSRRAIWYQLRGLFDAQQITYVVRGHHQGGQWWEADTMCEVDDRVQGLRGLYYVVSVQCSRDMRNGDQTTVSLRRPGLLAEIPLEA